MSAQISKVLSRISVVLVFVMCACSLTPERRAISNAEQVVRQGLNDPDSAKFSSERAHESAKYGMTVCGLVNGKNLFGAYVGFHRFYYWDASHVVEVDQGDDHETFDRTWAKTGCGGAEAQP